jgi:hypothetical protein
MCGKKFKQDLKLTHKAKATTTSIVAKLLEVKQAAEETVKNYFCRANKILWELKSNIDPDLILIPEVVLPADMAEQWTALQQEIRNTVINHVRTHTNA